MPNNRDLGPSTELAATSPRRTHAHVRRGGAACALALAATVALVACGDDGAHSDGAPAAFAGCELVGATAAPAAQEVAVQLAEYAVVPAASRVTAGAVRVVATNVGARPHELVVVRADGLADLATEKDGSLAEERLPDLALVGEIEEFPPTERCDAVFDLDPGEYVLLCNLVERVRGKTVVHLREGMATTFTVTG